MSKKSSESQLIELMEALESVGISATVQQCRELLPVVFRGRKKWTVWTEEEYDRLKKMYSEGTTRSEICVALNRSAGQINGAITRLKITRGGKA